MPDEISPNAAREIAKAVAAAFAAYDRGHAVHVPNPVLAIAETDVRRIIQEENDRLYERFLDHQERLFRRLRMPIDEENINATSDALGDLFDLNKTIKEATRSMWKDIGGSLLKWLGILVAGALGWAGITGGRTPH